MRKALFPMAAVALLATSFAAFADNPTHTGIIKSIDLRGKTLMLEDGTSYVLPVHFDDPGLKVGQKVKVEWKREYEMQNVKVITVIK